MKRNALFAMAAIASVLALREATKGRGPRVMEAMMSRCLEMMPDEAPPARILHDLETIREQNERMLRLLEERTSSPN